MEGGVKRPAAEELINTKKPRTESSTPETSEPPGSPDHQKLKAIKQQIEYYFSDQNLKRDQFFHTKISSNEEGWLEIKWILGCRKIQELNGNETNILEALKDSHLETKTEGDTIFIRRKTPLPSFEKPESKGNKKSLKSAPRIAGDIHKLGCLLAVSQVPEEVTWNMIREAAEAEVLKLCDGVKMQYNGKDCFRLRFASTINPNKTCYLYWRPFTEDLKILKQFNKLTINGVDMPVAFVDDVATATAVFDNLPPMLRNDRDKDFIERRRKLSGKPLKLADTEFASVEHLRKCCRELLEKTDPDTEVKEEAQAVIKAVLSYHPKAEAKLRDFKSIKAAIRTDIETDSNGSKCFFVVREDGSCEDFSLVKCFENLARNPPYLVE